MFRTGRITNPALQKLDVRLDGLKYLATDASDWLSVSRLNQQANTPRCQDSHRGNEAGEVATQIESNF